MAMGASSSVLGAAGGGLQRERPRYPAHRHARSVGGGEQVRELRPGEVRLGHHERGGQALLVAQPGEHGGRVAHRAEDGLAVDAPPGLGVAEGEEAEDAIGAAAVFQGAEEQVGSLPGADQENRPRFLGARGAGAAGVAHAVGDAWRTERRHQDEGVDDGEGGRGQREAGGDEEEGEEPGADGAAADDAEQVGHACEAPILLGQAEGNAGDEKGDCAAGEEPERAQQAERRVGDPARDGGGDRGEGAVEGDIEQDAVDGALRGHRGATV